MYGLVNKAIQDLVTEKFGAECWKQVVATANIETSRFVTTHVYDDKVTYDLVRAVSSVLNISPEATLLTIGKFWIDFVKRNGFESLLAANGNCLVDFLRNLDSFHSRLAANYPEYVSPEFHFRQHDDGVVDLGYFSKRPGFAPMVEGMIRGLANHFGEKIEMECQNRIDAVHFLITFADVPSTVTDVAISG